MSDAARTAVIEAYSTELKLPSVRRNYPELVRQAAHGGWDYEEFLVQLLEAEVLSAATARWRACCARRGSRTSRPSISLTGRRLGASRGHNSPARRL